MPFPSPRSDAGRIRRSRNRVASNRVGSSRTGADGFGEIDGLLVNEEFLECAGLGQAPGKGE